MFTLPLTHLTPTAGVSNYGIHHLEELLATAKVKPVVNQVEVLATENTMA